MHSLTHSHLSGISETLSDELEPFGIKSICVDLGYFRTPFLKDTQREPPVARIGDYQKFTEEREAIFRGEYKPLLNQMPLLTKIHSVQREAAWQSGYCSRDSPRCCSWNWCRFWEINSQVSESWFRLSWYCKEALRRCIEAA